MKEIKPEELQKNPFQMIGKEWLLVTAEKEGKTEFPFTMGQNQFDFIDYDRFLVDAKIYEHEKMGTEFKPTGALK